MKRPEMDGRAEGNWESEAPVSLFHWTRSLLDSLEVLVSVRGLYESDASVIRRPLLAELNQL